ncbi:CheY chemotaxis protein or a CheY-like REC (receiver) domain [Faunimonas pinastri]|uniref:CheY chemotaxis protein or a CheY-like REC (Receiver) domain n=1 Tax=Faunimonas pinastri TaxID=1855383 RepID=A0A1H9LY48_9HYPH|nr:response regulator [Faunimonas pinastri]SER16127.1 CheY chemotaxis protein or a CheY-like REC (receiver) domain [Faunimonas pinastri]
MSLVANTAPHLPYLRRFARALTGGQKSGDNYVIAVLEALVADPESFNADNDPRVELFKAFCRYWNSIEVNLASDNYSGEELDNATRRLEAITPLPRQAFLLMAVEDFSKQEIAYILGKSEPEVTELVDQAGREIAQQVATDVLIIEDEPLIAMDIESLVKSLGHNVSGMARTHSEAIQAVEQHRPGLVLADIQLADGSSGLDAVNEMLQSFSVPVVFITAYPERLLTGERPEPAFLITKPFQPETVKAVISQALFFEKRAGN